MKARVIMPPKFLAVFSNREKILRLSLSHPISRSTMLRRRYASLSNAMGRASRSSFSLDGMTGLIPKSSRYSSIQLARYPLSPPRANGQAIGSPVSSNKDWSAPISTSSRTDDSCVWPAVKWKHRGKPLLSQRTWIFVENPPRERPKAWSSGSEGSPFFRRQPHIARHARWCRRCTTIVRRSLRLWQKLPEDVAKSRRVFRWHSIDRIFASRFARNQTLEERPAKENRCATPIKLH